MTPTLTNSERKLMAALYCEDLTPTECGRVVGSNFSGATYMLRSLKRKGLVEEKGDKWAAR